MNEQQYMEESWSKENHQAYKTEKVDKSVMEFERFLKAKKFKGNILDIGCGNGKNTIYFEKNGYNSTGIDFAPSAIKICKAQNSKAKFEVQDVLEYKSEKKYRAIIDCGCLHHIRKRYWGTYKKTILNNLESKGYYYLHGICDCIENKKLPKHPKNRNWIINKKGHYTHFISEKEIQEEFGKYFRTLKQYKFKSENSSLTVIAFYMQRIR